MSFFRLTTLQTAQASTPEADRPEGLFARMIRLWIEHHERVVEFRIRDF